MKTILSFILCMVLSVSLFGQTKSKVTIEKLNVICFSTTGTDLHRPYKTGDKTQFLIKGGGGGLDTLETIPMEGLDSIQVVIAVNDSINCYVSASAVSSVGGVAVYSDTTDIGSGVVAGSYNLVAGAGTFGFSWQQINAALHPPNAFTGIRLIIRMDAQESATQSLAKYGTVWVKKYWR